jgi:Protein of unknown function (DUF3618)
MSDERERVEQAERTPEQIRAEIALTREELGQTVAAAAAKTDVKAQAQKKADEVKAQARAKLEDAQELAKRNPMSLALTATALALLVLWRARRG